MQLSYIIKTMSTFLTKTITVLMLLISFSINNFSYANNFLGSWTRVADFGGTARQYAVGFSIDTMGYLGLGADSAGLPSDFWSYNPNTNSWNTISPFPSSGRTSPLSFSYDSVAFVGLGRDTNNFNYDLWKYYAQIDLWANTGQALPVPPRTEAVGFAIGNTGYVTTGVGGASEYFNDITKFDMSLNQFDTLSPNNTLPNGRYAATGFSLNVNGNSYGYMGLGIDDSTYYNDFWQYDPIADAWTQEADFGGTPRFGAISFTACGYGYVGLGEDLNSTYRQDVWRYDPYTNVWTFVNHFPGTGRRNAVAFTVNNIAYVGTGWDGNGRTKDFYSFSCDSTTGIKTTQQSIASATIFPNPNNGNFEIVYDLQNCADAVLSLTDMSGRMVGTYQLPSSKNRLKINQSVLNNGIYFYSIKTNERTIESGKFSVIK
jgi:N-acetylneuraminic acid mutarotase